MARIKVVPSEAEEYRQARKQRARLGEVAMQLAESWPDCWDDPLAVEVLRGLALAYFIDGTHPLDRQGRCTRRRCRRWWLLARRRCIARSILRVCRTVDTVNLWFYVLNRVPGSSAGLTEVRTWVAQCQTSKSQTQPRDQRDKDGG